ncbi:hypothetical protein PoB_006543900 [Plakobranchus ocellatus]|uniref:Uncharacterized protein n=1 Tax=Plakobranchus ocellatus TaxID=259542 RepID=A0AAV4D427_9GAST|nr:hypothetical protein PoB_006543900 [Plakobranchus ocellatus]
MTVLSSVTHQLAQAVSCLLPLSKDERLLKAWCSSAVNTHGRGLAKDKATGVTLLIRRESPSQKLQGWLSIPRDRQVLNLSALTKTLPPGLAQQSNSHCRDTSSLAAGTVDAMETGCGNTAARNRMWSDLRETRHARQTWQCETRNMGLWPRKAILVQMAVATAC